MKYSSETYDLGKTFGLAPEVIDAETENQCPVCLALGIAGVTPEEAAKRQPVWRQALVEAEALPHDLNDGPSELCWDCRALVGVARVKAAESVVVVYCLSDARPAVGGL